MVVARAHAVEHRTGHLGAERLAGRLAEGDLDLDAVARDQQFDVGLVGPQLPFDDVAGDASVEAEHGVTRLNTRRFGGRPGRDSDDNRNTHGRSRLRATCGPRSLTS
jgi:hypothetical protein